MAKQSAAVMRALIDQAKAQVEGFPQYANSFDDVRVVRVTKRLTTKLGVAFEPGDLVLMTSAASPTLGNEFATCWSFRNKCHTSIRHAWLQTIEIEGGAS